MLIENELTSHLLDIDDICRERIDMLVKQIAEKENVNEELKTQNQLEWVAQMNNIKNRVEEIIANEIIYQQENWLNASDKFKEILSFL